MGGTIEEGIRQGEKEKTIFLGKGGRTKKNETRGAKHGGQDFNLSGGGVQKKEKERSGVFKREKRGGGGERKRFASLKR